MARRFHLPAHLLSAGIACGPVSGPYGVGVVVRHARISDDSGRCENCSSLRRRGYGVGARVDGCAAALDPAILGEGFANDADGASVKVHHLGQVALAKVCRCGDGREDLQLPRDATPGMAAFHRSTRGPVRLFDNAQLPDTCDILSDERNCAVGGSPGANKHGVPLRRNRHCVGTRVATRMAARNPTFFRQAPADDAQRAPINAVSLQIRV